MDTNEILDDTCINVAHALDLFRRRAVRRTAQLRCDIAEGGLIWIGVRSCLQNNCAFQNGRMEYRIRRISELKSVYNASTSGLTPCCYAVGIPAKVLDLLAGPLESGEKKAMISHRVLCNLHCFLS